MSNANYEQHTRKLSKNAFKNWDEEGGGCCVMWTGGG